MFFNGQIIVLWTAKERIPEKRKWPLVGVTIIVQRINIKVRLSINECLKSNTAMIIFFHVQLCNSSFKRGDSRMSVRFVTTDAILSLDEDVNLKIDEVMKISSLKIPIFRLRGNRSLP